MPLLAVVQQRVGSARQRWDRTDSGLRFVTHEPRLRLKALLAKRTMPSYDALGCTFPLRRALPVAARASVLCGGLMGPLLQDAFVVSWPAVVRKIADRSFFLPQAEFGLPC